MAKPEQITLVAGGDVGNSADAEATNEQVLRSGADAILLGGDLAYDNNLAECYEVWDLLLQRLPYASTDGDATRLVPLFMGIGKCIK